MSKFIILDEVHVTFRIPADLPDAEAETVRRTLAGAEFVATLRRVARTAVRAFPELATVRLRLTR